MRVFYVISTLLLIALSINQSVSLEPPNEEKLRLEKLPPCAACKVLVESFKKGIEKTKRGKFEGGDSAWEEDKLKSYAKSEVRLTEIEENLCKDVTKGEAQCHALAEEYESAIEDWWFKRQDAYPDIYVYICIKHAKKCCLKDHYGPECTKCPGYPDKICSNNGKCKGSGTRKGNGQCACDLGYSGKNCTECAHGYYESYRDNTKLLCSLCHPACVNGCTAGGSKNCQGGCKVGWKLVNDQECVDINECLEQTNICLEDQFCVNKEGNYSCLNCDKTCKGCSGDGPDMCTECAEGYTKKDNICMSKSHSEL